MIYDLLCCGPQRIRYIQSLYSDLGILAFSTFPEQLFQWHNEENSSYTATALYGILTRFPFHLHRCADTCIPIRFSMPRIPLLSTEVKYKSSKYI